MKFPCFEDFLASLTPDKIENILADARKKNNEAAGFGLGGQSAAVSWTVSLELLSLYHLWLQESLQEP